jgi:hypothetical protein
MMKKSGFLLWFLIVMIISELKAQKIIDLTNTNLKAVNTLMTLEKMDGEKVVRVVKNPAVKKFDEPTFVRINHLNFTHGIIEVKVLSRILADAPNFARGFIGIAFHINETNSQFESIYIRPLNAREDDQIRRNRSIQYFSYPNYKYQRLRRKFQNKYESYADMTLNEWIQLRVEVQGQKAKLYINNNKQPSLIVNDLKLGSNETGSIGLFVDVGTEGYFKDVKVYLQ